MFWATVILPHVNQNQGIGYKQKLVLIYYSFSEVNLRIVHFYRKGICCFSPKPDAEQS